MARAFFVYASPTFKIIDLLSPPGRACRVSTLLGSEAAVRSPRAVSLVGGERMP